MSQHFSISFPWWVNSLAFPKCTSMGPSVSMDTVLVKECSAVLGPLRVGFGIPAPLLWSKQGFSPVGLLIYDILFYNVLYTIATQSPVDFPSRSHLSQETHKGEPSQSPCTEEGPICSSSDLGRSPRLRSTWLQRPCPDSPASPIPLPRWFSSRKTYPPHRLAVKVMHPVVS